MSVPTREAIIALMQGAAERMGLDLEDLQEMIGEVLEDCSSKAALLKEAVITKNAANIRAIAHDIKGSTANYGLQEVSDLALKLEKNNENPALEDVEEMISLLSHISGLGINE
ncbi:MAG: Hpt domain-containing protein [SAR324 cluster bacterium]|nr:Hpt domain-containing protein [SAR324 cluster bacterium]